MDCRLPITKIIPVGVEAEFVDVDIACTYLVRNTGGQHISIRNNGALQVKATVICQRTMEELEIEDRKITVPAGKSKVAGPFLKTAFNDPYGDVHIEFDGDDNVSIAVFEY